MIIKRIRNARPDNRGVRSRGADYGKFPKLSVAPDHVDCAVLPGGPTDFLRAS